MVPMEGAGSPKVVVRRVDRLMSEHLKSGRRSKSSHIVALLFEVQRTVVTIHLALPMPQKLLNSIKK
jgi:hypothetical protein